MTKRLTPGGQAWIGLVIYIAAYDLWATRTGRDTLSMAFYNSIRHPVRRWPVIVIWSYLTAHLFKFLPDKVDPLRLPWKDYYTITIVRYRARGRRLQQMPFHSSHVQLTLQQSPDQA